MVKMAANREHRRDPRERPRHHASNSEGSLSANIQAVHACKHGRTSEGVDAFHCPSRKTNEARRAAVGSTEVLESCFGKRKELERQSSRGGFTSLVISFGAMSATTTTEAINAALKHSRVAEVYNGCERHLGTTRFENEKSPSPKAQQNRDETSPGFSSAQPTADTALHRNRRARTAFIPRAACRSPPWSAASECAG